MSRNVVRLNESQLHRVIKESVKRVLREGNKINNRPFDDYYKEKEKEARDNYFQTMGDWVKKNKYQSYPSFDDFYSHLDRKSVQVSNDISSKLDDLAQNYRDVRYSRERNRKEPVRQGRKVKGHLLPSKALFAMKQCENKLGVRLSEENVPLYNNFGVFMGTGPAAVYTVCTSSYEDGPEPDLSGEINEILKANGFTMHKSTGGGSDEREYASYKRYYWFYEPLFGYDY